MNQERKKYLLKNSIDGFVVAFIMGITASILGFIGENDVLKTVFTTPSTWYCIPFSFAISWIITLVIPSCKISQFFAGRFGFNPNSVSGVLFGDLFTNIYICAILSLACKMLVFLPSWNLVWNAFLSTFLIQYIVSYIAFEVSNLLTLQLIYKKWDKKDEQKKECME